jgi:hypothetical protein
MIAARTDYRLTLLHGRGRSSKGGQASQSPRWSTASLYVLKHDDLFAVLMHGEISMA